MAGQLSNDIIELFKNKFEGNCISLLLEAYQSLLNSGRTMNEESENNITAQLVGFIKSNPKRNNFEISVERESYLDGEEIYDGTKDANESLRIDVKYTVWNSNSEYTYHIEAKNIAENNWRKVSNNTIIDANKLRKRYVSSGIENFITGKYPKGCLVGYVLEGHTPNIVNKVNLLLLSENRAKESLKNSTDHDIDDMFYISNHERSSHLLLKHYFLNFVQNLSAN